ncbi:MAG: L-type lectin-domain containing protein [Pseudomonadota bacterium]|nr:L-type lectin-domain containing protein [Pseudomonadota bacterium]
MRTSLFLFLAACTEYGIEGQKEEPPVLEDTAGVPDVAVTPLALDLGVLCAGTVAEAQVEVSNVGTEALSVTGADVEGEGWAVGEVALPATLQPGEVLAIPLTGGPGLATLTLHTDDPDSPEIEVPLRAALDAPPTATITTPVGGDVLAGDVSAVFAGLVSDDADPAELLTVAWASDIDGVVGAGPAAASGDTSIAWDPTVRTAGSHVVTLSATDSCGQTVSDAVTICQDQGYTADNLDLATWNFEGSAAWDATNGWVELTQPLGNQSGTAFQTATTVSADNVSIEFRFYVSGGTGADGISVTALDSSRMTSFVGEAGGGMGYGGLPGWSIEVDTWYNSEYGDPTQEDHVSIHFDGQPFNPGAWAALPEMEDGAWHDMAVTVLARHVTVSIDGVTYIDQNLPGFTAFPAYVGFTAATGSVTNYHLIDALTVTRNVCDE